MNDAKNTNEADKKTIKKTNLIPVGYYVEEGYARRFVPNPNHPKYSSGQSAPDLNNDFDKSFYLPDGSLNYDKINNMNAESMKTFRGDRRNATQIIMSKMLSGGKDLNELAKNIDIQSNRKELVTLLAKNLYFNGGVWKNADTLFIIIDPNRYIEFEEKMIARLICDLYGMNEKQIISIMPDIVKQIKSYCKRDGLEFNDKNIREHWHIVNFSNFSYDVIARTPYIRAVAAKIGYVNTRYINKADRGENDGGMQKFAAL
jgi:hypothetical protein